MGDAMPREDLLLFALASSADYGRQIGAALAVPVAAHEEHEFADGEHKARPLVNVRGRDCFVLLSLHGDERYGVNDKLCRLLFFIGALKDASAARVTAVVPYLAYARKDRKAEPRDPVTTRYVAALFEAAGTDRLVTLDVHNLAAFQNAFRCPTDHLEARLLFADFFPGLIGEQPVTVLSPDAGGMKRAERFRAALSARLGRPVAMGFMEKQRTLERVSGSLLVADVRDRAVIVFDDLISSGTTMLHAAMACRDAGAARVYAAATHGVFVDGAGRVLADPVFERVVVTDSVPPFRLTSDAALGKLSVVSAAPLFAEAIRRIHDGGSLTALLEPRP